MRSLLLLVLTCARADTDISENTNLKILLIGRRSLDATGGCVYSGRVWTEGAAVAVRDSCLRCRCARGALSCARAACAPAPDPPPRRCALLHRRDSCCPELHCPDGVKSLEMSEAARLEYGIGDVMTPSLSGNACVEDGAVFAAGSALSARVACEQCFCLRGARHCVRPRCLPAPPGCAPRPAPGACCPQRFYCDAARPHASTPVTSTPVHHRQDCEINGEWVSEGERVPSSAAGGDNCTQCFCLRGELRCQQLACAPALRGCTPLLHAGHCCPHQYHCPHRGSLMAHGSAITDNSLIPTRNDERSFRTSASPKVAGFSKTSSSIFPTRTRSAVVAPTTKVKRKTDDLSPTTTTDHRSTQNNHTDGLPPTTITTDSPTTSPSSSPVSMTTSTPDGVPGTTEQPEGSVKIIINGTINCTAELSSGISNMSASANVTGNVESQVQSRVPQREETVEAHTLSPTDIITERTDFDGSDSITVSVSSSLRANTSLTSAAAAPPPPGLAPVATVSSSGAAVANNSKEDYDYDYTEPTLPPSLPNLKIIPFVAADAVLDEEVSAKEDSLLYTALDREDKFPVYYPSVQTGAGSEAEAGDTMLANRREDVYSPSQYPGTFVSDQVRPGLYSALMAADASKGVFVPSVATTTRDQAIETPSVNLFSPPVETEGGFVPKGPGIIDEYYAVYPSTPPPAPHLTTSMQINPNTPDAGCITIKGVQVAESASVRVGCAMCTCEWAELRCTPLRCRTPSSCRRRAVSTAVPPETVTTSTAMDLCCGEHFCDEDDATKPTSTTPMTTTDQPASTSTEINAPMELHADLIPFDPPPDRSVPATASTTTATPKPAELVTIAVKNETTVIAASVSPTVTQVANMNTAQPSYPLTKVNNSLSSTGIPPAARPSMQETNLIPDRKEINDTDHQPQEYEDEEEEDGFSFGSVLKLLLSDSYDTTTISPAKRRLTTAAIKPSPSSVSIPTSPPTTARTPSRPSAVTPAHLPKYSYSPPKRGFVPNTVNRIDHLVLGEATAIRKSSLRPTLPPKISTRTSSRPEQTTRNTGVPTAATPAPAPPPVTRGEALQNTPHSPRPVVGGGGGGGGLFKLAGCNIYGRMYRVGRIIAELSTPCQECRCTELGVQCAPLRC